MRLNVLWPKWLKAWRYILAILLFSAFLAPHTHLHVLLHHDNCLACQLSQTPKLKVVEHIISPSFEVTHQLSNPIQPHLIAIYIKRFYGLSPPILSY